MMDNRHFSKTIRAAVWYTVSNFLVKGITFLSVPVFSRLMSRQEFGDYSNFFTWLHLLTMVVSCNLYASVNRARFTFPDRLDAYCSTILLTGSAITAVFYAAAILFMPVLESLFSLEAFHIHLMFVYLLVQPALDVYMVRQRVTYHYRSAAAVSMLSVLTSTAGAVALTIGMRNRFYGRVIGYLLPQIAVCLGVYLFQCRKGHSFRAEFARYAVGYSWPFVPHLLANYILSASDRIMITRMCGSEYTAVYTISCNCASIASLYLSSINSAAAPWVFDMLKEKNTAAVRRVTIPYSLAFLLPVTFLLLLAPEILWILGGAEYAGALDTIVPLIVSVVFQFAYCLYVNVEQYERKTWAVASGTMIAAAVNVGLNKLLIPIFGYRAAAYTTLAGYMLLFVIHYTFVRMIGYRRVYHDQFVFGFLCVAFVSQFFFVPLYRYTVARYALLSGCFPVTGYVLWRNRERLKSFLARR